MVRSMEIDGEMYRAVILKKKMVSNPAYDWRKGYNQTDADGQRIPSSIPSETETYQVVRGPYARKGDATTQMKREMNDGYGNQQAVVGGHIEHAIITWEVLDD
jgi:hypothetical protein